VIPDADSLVLFMVASFALAFVPGPAVLYIVAESVQGGRLAGLVSALGIATGGFVHVVFAAVGLSSLLVSSATAFEVVKYAGAAYLIYLGIRRLLKRDEPDAERFGQARSRRSLFSQGVVVNVLNPKTAIFFFAFLPQFIDPDAGWVPGQILLLGLVFIAIALVSDSMWALAAGTAGRWLRNSRRWLSVQRWVSGSVFVGLGLATALTGHRSKTS
jgi:threonine/homoserine/homoserine lactone efflux protein